MHAIDTVSLGRASYASTEREWHTLGELMEPGQSVEEWQEASGMNYHVQRAFVRYATGPVSVDGVQDILTIKDKVVLFRSDTKADLGVVSDNYKVVQPRAVLEFFREWADMGGLTIESAGVLFGGRRYFATAKLCDGVALDEDGRDKIVPYALLSTSADGSLATECRWTTVRTVCNNTLTMARNSAACYKTTHRSIFKPQLARDAVEQAHAEFGAFMQSARLLSAVPMNAARAAEATIALLTPASGASGEAQAKARESLGFGKIMSLFGGAGRGSQLMTARNTEWGWLNAVTDYADHEIRARSDENRTASALWGAGDALKQKALSLVSA